MNRSNSFPIFPFLILTFSIYLHPSHSVSLSLYLSLSIFLSLFIPLSPFIPLFPFHTLSLYLSFFLCLSLSLSFSFRFSFSRYIPLSHTHYLFFYRTLFSSLNQDIGIAQDGISELFEKIADIKAKSSQSERMVKSYQKEKFH